MLKLIYFQEIRIAQKINYYENICHIFKLASFLEHSETDVDSYLVGYLYILIFVKITHTRLIYRLFEREIMIYEIYRNKCMLIFLQYSVLFVIVYNYKIVIIIEKIWM